MAQFLLLLVTMYVLPFFLVGHAANPRIFADRPKLQVPTLSLSTVVVLTILAGALFDAWQDHPWIQWVFWVSMGALAGIHMTMGLARSKKGGGLLQFIVGALTLICVYLVAATIKPLSIWLGVAAICVAVLAGVLVAYTWHRQAAPQSA